MALRDQPYLPLFIQDFLTDERLIECSASATGVFIRIMCLMHKEEEYGKILLRQKNKQTGRQISDFAIQLAGKMPYNISVIEAGLQELLDEGVLRLKDDFIIQKRMVEDNELSIKRSKSGKIGGTAKAEKDKNFAINFAKAKNIPNTEIVNEYVNEDVNNTDRGVGKVIQIIPPSQWDQEKLNFTSAGGWMVKFTTTKKISLVKLEDLMAEFIADIELKSDYKPFKELQSHFTNWYNKTKKDGKSHQQVATSDKFRTGATAENYRPRRGGVNGG